MKNFIIGHNKGKSHSSEAGVRARSHKKHVLRWWIITVFAFMLAALFSLVLSHIILSIDNSNEASAANLANFDAGNIITDQNFYTSGTMTVSQIQSFLNEKGAACSGSMCIKNYHVTTTQGVADGLCSGYPGGKYLSAAQAISAVSKACNISEKVLLVTLQKEQGLITTTHPTATMYNYAMGYGCPDTGSGCNPNYGGLYHQLYTGAWQFQKYKSTPNSWGYRPNAWNNIKYNPNSACGTKSVYIKNYATAGLYIYTPYTPNQAALNAGYGIGNSCSSYGNRNFYNYYSDWFGSPNNNYTVKGDIAKRYYKIGGSSSNLGMPTTNEISVAGGAYQRFQGGVIYWTASTGAWENGGEIRTRYISINSFKGNLGWPTSAEIKIGTKPYRTYQKFQNGEIYYTSSTGAHEVYGKIRERYNAMGAYKALGYPTSSEIKIGTKPYRTYQKFQNGEIYYTSSTGAHEVYGKIRERYNAMGAYKALGYPTSSEIKIGTKPYRTYQQFQNGEIYYTSSTGAHEVYGKIRERYNALGSYNSALGYPISSEIKIGTKPYRTYQQFQNGEIYYTSSTGACEVYGTIRDKYNALGSYASDLGYPTSSQVTKNGQTYQKFQNGTIYWTSSKGAWVVYNNAKKSTASDSTSKATSEATSKVSSKVTFEPTSETNASLTI